MSEQLRRLRENRIQRQNPLASQQTRQADDISIRQAQEQIKKLDAAFNEYLAQPNALGPGMTAGEQQAQQLVAPLSSEAFVQGFRQPSGE